MTDEYRRGQTQKFKKGDLNPLQAKNISIFTIYLSLMLKQLGKNANLIQVFYITKTHAKGTQNKQINSKTHQHVLKQRYFSDLIKNWDSLLF